MPNINVLITWAFSERNVQANLLLRGQSTSSLEVGSDWKVICLADCTVLGMNVLLL
jgi:hypothetical protein